MSDMSVSSVSASSIYTGTNAVESKKTEKDAAGSAAAVETGAVYEKTADTSDKKPATYSINKMSAEDRASLVEQLKQEQANRESQLIEIVHKMMTGQATAFAKSDESMWKFLASGEFTVDEAAKAQAQEDISEDGYWGIKQTSQRLFDFASALAGDDEEKMKEMQAAMEKGFKQATGTWGRELPEISKNTFDAANKLFDDYYASKKAPENVIAEDGVQ